MHYHAEVYFKTKPRNLKQAVQKAFGAYKEPNWWDWYVIGGRWEDVHIQDRQKILGQYCDNTDCIEKVENLSNEAECYTLIIPHKKRVKHRDRWDGKNIVPTDFDGKIKPYLAGLGIKTGYVVTVDYHN